MSRNTVELVAKFRDEASVGLRRLATEANRTMQIQSRAASSSGRQQQLMHAAAARLGIRTEREIRREIQRTQAAYNAMAKSGRASHNELARAAQQTRSRIRELNAEMNSGSRFNRMIQGGKSLARGAASVAARAGGGRHGTLPLPPHRSRRSRRGECPRLHRRGLRWCRTLRVLRESAAL